MRVQVVYKNHNLQTVNIAEYDLSVFCLELSNKIIKTLSIIESLLEVDTLKDDEAHQKIRHTLLDAAGSIRRLPDNLLLEPGQKIVWEEELTQSEIEEENQNIGQEEKPQKLTLSLVQKLFGKVGE